MNTSIVETEVLRRRAGGFSQKIRQLILRISAFTRALAVSGTATQWAAGYRAYADSAAVNPHPRGSKYHKEWDLGRDAASEDAE